jgi:hypothetical protein
VLRWFSPRSELNLILELYLRELTGRLFQDIQSVIVYGSAALDDLAPDFGDVDLLVAIRREPGESARGEIELIHRYLATPGFAPWGRLLEAVYLPLPVVTDPNKEGRGLRASARGIARCDKHHLKPIDLFSIQHHGVTLYGQDIKRSVIRPRWRDLYPYIRELTARARALGEGATTQEYVGLCTAMVKTLHALDQGKVVSKTEATRWFERHVGGKAGDAAVEANRLRRGELKTGIGGLRRLVPFLIEVVESELSRIERARLPKSAPPGKG